MRLKKGKCYRVKADNGEIIKGKFSGHKHHFGGDTEYPEIVEKNGARHYVLKSKLRKC